MKKLATAFILSLCLCVTLLTSCSDSVPEKPDDTTLEFWIAQCVSDSDFAEHREIPGLFGGQQFYGKDYAPVSNDDTQIYTPSVIYTVTSYPDYSDDEKHVTRIDITDPNVSVYGITCSSSLSDFDKTFEDQGFTVRREEYFHVATRGKFNFVLVSNGDPEAAKLSVWVEVTNKYGIVF